MRKLVAVVCVLALVCCADKDADVVTAKGSDIVVWYDTLDTTNLITDEGVTPDLAVADASPAPVDTLQSSDSGQSPNDVGAVVSDTSKPASDPNAGWIGGSCTQDSDCDYDGGTCLLENQGYPGGMCTKACTKYCPDHVDGGHPITFCIDGEDQMWTQPQCVSRCNYNIYKWGCRDGYHCGARARSSDPGTVEYVCIPGSGPKPPGLKCYQELAELGVLFQPKVNKKAKVSGTNVTCDIYDAVTLHGVIDGIPFKYAKFDSEAQGMYGSCRLGKALYKTVQRLHDLDVLEVVHLGTYNCRFIGGTNPPLLSEHGNGTAIDFSGFKTLAGDEYFLENDWEVDATNPVTPGGQLLSDFAAALFNDDIFNIILTPDYDHCTSKAHYNHFHVDLSPGKSFISLPNTCDN